MYVQLPFMEDLRQFTFPSLENNKKFTPSGTVPACQLLFRFKTLHRTELTDSHIDVELTAASPQEGA